MYLEAFLLHYRNLIYFLGGENLRSGDLHITNIWQLANLTAPTNRNDIYEKGKKLRAQYEPSNAQGGGRISEYLQHMTEKRIEAKGWEISTMYNDIEPLLSDVEQHLGPHTGLLALIPVKTLDYFSASTTVGTFTAVTPRLIDKATLTKPKDFE